MSVPKRRRSSAVRDAGRSHLALKKVQLGKCSHCQAAIKTHQMCPVCGYYKGRQILDIVKKKEDRKKRKEDQRKKHEQAQKEEAKQEKEVKKETKKEDKKEARKVTI